MAYLNKNVYIIMKLILARLLHYDLMYLSIADTVTIL